MSADLDDTTTSSSETCGHAPAASAAPAAPAAATARASDRMHSVAAATATDDDDSGSESLSSWGGGSAAGAAVDSKLKSAASASSAAVGCSSATAPRALCKKKQKTATRDGRDTDWPAMDSSESDDDDESVDANEAARPEGEAGLSGEGDDDDDDDDEDDAPLAPPAIVGGFERQLAAPKTNAAVGVREHARAGTAAKPKLVRKKPSRALRYKQTSTGTRPRGVPAAPLPKSAAESMRLAATLMKKYAASKKESNGIALQRACKKSAYLTRLANALAGLHAYASTPAKSRAPSYEDEFFAASGAELGAADAANIECAHTHLRSAFSAVGFPLSLLDNCSGGGDGVSGGSGSGSWSSSGRSRAGGAVGPAAAAFEAHANAYACAVAARYRQMPEMETRAINDLDDAAAEIVRVFTDSGQIPPERLQVTRDAVYEHNQDVLQEIRTALQGTSRVAQEGVEDYYAATGGALSDTLNTNELLPALTLLFGGDQASARREWQRHLQLEEAMLAEIKRSGETSAFLEARRKHIEHALSLGMRIDANSRTWLERAAFVDDVSFYPDDVEPCRGPDAAALRARGADDGVVTELNIHHHHHHYVLCKPEDYTEPPVLETYGGGDSDCVERTCASLAELGRLHRSQLAGVALATFQRPTGDYFGPDAGDDERFAPEQLREDLGAFVASQVNADSQRRRAVAQALVANVVQRLSGGNPDRLHALATIVINLAVTEARSLKCSRDESLTPLLQRMAAEITALAGGSGGGGGSGGFGLQPALRGAERARFLEKLASLSAAFEKRFLTVAANGASGSGGSVTTPNESSGVARNLAASLVSAVSANVANDSLSGKYVFIERQAPFYLRDTILYPETLYDVIAGMLAGIKRSLDLIDPPERELAFDEWREAASQISRYAAEVAGAGGRPVSRQPDTRGGRDGDGRGRSGPATTTTTTTTPTTTTTTGPGTTTGPAATTTTTTTTTTTAASATPSATSPATAASSAAAVVAAAAASRSSAAAAATAPKAAARTLKPGKSRFAKYASDEDE